MAVTEQAIASEIRKIIEESGDGSMLDDVPLPSEQQIRAAEEELGVRFPYSYRVFLSHFGSGAVVCHPIAGVTDASWCQHIAQLHKRFRSIGTKVPDHLVYFTSDGGELNYYFETSHYDADGECPVVVIPAGFPEGTVVASSFLDFLRRLHRGEQLVP